MIILNKENQKKYTFNSDSKVAYDGCHKIYICEDEKEVKEAIEIGYEIHEISGLEKLYNASCPLVFISNWKLSIQYVPQCSEVEFINIKNNITLEYVQYLTVKKKQCKHY